MNDYSLPREKMAELEQAQPSDVLVCAFI